MMDCIDSTCDKMAPPKNGQLYFVKNNVVAELVVSKYQRLGIEGFKAFFCNDVLELHYPGTLNIKEYEEYFGNRNGKKYAITPEKMNRLLDKEQNDAYYIKSYELNPEKPEQWKTALMREFCPRLLLERLKKVTYVCLKDYFLCEGKEQVCRNKKKFSKKERYSRFVMSACLYEIFVEKYLGDVPLEKAFTAVKEFHTYMEKMMPCIQRLKEKKEECKTIKKEEKERIEQYGEEMLSLGKELQNHVDRLQRVIEDVGDLSERAIYYMVHMKYLSVFTAIICLVEFKNIQQGDNVPKKIKNMSMNNQLDFAFEKELDYIFFNEISMNKNATALYRTFMENAEQERLLRKLCSTSEKTQRNAVNMIRKYFEKVKNKEYSDTEFEKVVNEIAWTCLNE